MQVFHKFGGRIHSSIINSNLESLEAEIKDRDIDPRRVVRDSPTLMNEIVTHPFTAGMMGPNITNFAELEKQMRKPRHMWRMDEERMDRIAQVIAEKNDNYYRFESEARFWDPTGGPGVEWYKQQALQDLRADEEYIAGEGAPGVWEALTFRARENPAFLVPFLGTVKDITNYTKLFDATNALNNNEATEEQTDFLIRFGRLMTASESRGSDVFSIVGEGLAELPAFALEFATTGGAYRATKAVAITWLKRSLQRALGKTSGRLAVKTVATAAGGVAQFTLASPLRIAARTTQRMTPMTGLDEGLRPTIMGPGEEIIPAMLKAAGENYVEILSERSGFFLTKWIPSIKRVIMNRWLKLNPDKGVSGFLDKLGKKAGWNGVIPEVFEERVGAFGRALIPGHEDDFEDIVPSAEQFWGEMITFAVPGLTANTLRVAARPFTAQTTAPDSFDRIGQVVQDLQRGQIVPEEAERVIKSIADDNGTPSVRVNAEEFHGYFQDQKNEQDNPIIPQEEARKLGISSEQYKIALESNQDLVIPYEKYALELAPTRHNEFFKNHLKTRADEMTPTEQKVFREEVKKQEAELRKQTAGVEKEAVTIRKGIAKQLRTAGIKAREAGTAAGLVEATFRTMAMRSGLRPSELLERRPFRILKGDPTARLQLGDPAVFSQPPVSKRLIRIRENMAKVMRELPPNQQLTASEAADSLANTFGTKALRNTEVEFLLEDLDARELNIRFRGRDLAEEIDALGEIFLEQAAEGRPARGRISFTDINALIELLPGADPSTFMHEFTHYYLELMGDITTLPGISEQIKEDFNTLIKHGGVENLAAWESMSLEERRDAHEIISRSMEAYLREGKAPSLSLRNAFLRFFDWLGTIYKSIIELNVALTPEVREVFDRIFATDAEIEAVRSEENADPFYKLLRNVGMSPKQARRMEDKIAATHVAQWNTLLNKTFEDIRGKRTKEYEKLLKQVRKDVEKQVNLQPDYVAEAALRRGTKPDGSPLNEDTPQMKLDRNIVIAEFPLRGIAFATEEQAGKARVENLPPSTTAVEGGVHPDNVAEELGFSSGDQLIQALTNLRDKKEFIDEIAERQVLQILELSDISADPAALHDEAIKAMYSRDRSLQLVDELKIMVEKDFATFNNLKKRIAFPVPTMLSVRLEAEKTIGAIRARDLQPAMYQRATARSAKKAVEAGLKGDWVAAFQQKRQELINQELYRAALGAQKRIQKGIKKTRRFNKRSIRERILKGRNNFMHQIDAVMDRIGFPRTGARTPVEDRKPLDTWVREQQENGYDPLVPEVFENAAFQGQFLDMQVQQLEEVFDFLDNIAFLSQLNGKLLTAKRQQDLEKAVTEIVTTVQENSRGKKSERIDTGAPTDRIRKLIEGFFASHRKIAMIVHEMDGFKDGGPIWELIIRPINEAADREVTERAAAAERLTTLFKGIRKSKNFWLKRHIPEIDGSLDHAGLLMVALNWGNEDNRRKLMDGRGWTEQQVQSMLNRLDKQDWNFVQKTWDFIDEFWEGSKALSERTTGVAPEKVQPAPITNQFGIFSGGYFPLKYGDRKAHADIVTELANESKRGATITATTRHGSRKARVKGVMRKVRLDFGVIFEHINEIIHDQTHYEMLLDVNRLLRNDRVASAIEDHYGEATLNQLVNTVKDIAAGEAPSQLEWEKMVNWGRIGVSIASMGWNLSTAAIQVTGITNSVVRLGGPVTGAKWLYKGFREFIGSAKRREQGIEWIYSRSLFMKNRARTQMREINEVRNTLKRGGEFLGPIQNSYFWLITRMQLMVDVPTWLAAYEKHVNESPLPTTEESREDIEETAARIADQIVIDSQGGGQIKDLAAIQRGGPLLKIWTNFYHFFNTVYNLMRNSVGRVRGVHDIGRLAVDFAILVPVTASMGFFLRELIREDDDDDDDLTKRLAGENASYLLGTMVGLREFQVAFTPFDYEGPSGTRLFSEAKALAVQIEQLEADEPAWRAANKFAGILFHYPSTQLDRIVRGMLDLFEGETRDPRVLITGPSFRR